MGADISSGLELVWTIKGIHYISGMTGLNCRTIKSMHHGATMPGSLVWQ